MKRLKWLILLCPLLLTGCWSQLELNERAFVAGIYIDKAAKGNMEVSLSFTLPNRLVPGDLGGAGSSGKPYTILSATGKSFTEAYKKIQATITRNISWGHTRIIIISEEMARDGIKDILEFVVREPSLNINQALLIAPGKAKDIEKLTPIFERFPSSIPTSFTQRKITMDTTTKDFLEAHSGDMIVSLLSKKIMKMLSEGGKEGLFVSPGEMALFHNYKMVGKLDTKAGRGALWLRNLIKDAEVTMNSPTDQHLISLLVMNANSKIRPSKNKPFTFNVDINAEGHISESHSNINLSNEKNIAQLELTAEKQIRNRIKATLKASQEEKADVFQFGEYLSWYKPKIWKKVKNDWPEVYHEKVKLNVHIDLKIRRLGSENDPFWIKGRNL
ncbi:Ger(x)C family spore germination protein [Bacillus salipaludis]|uniref:Ger(X)C family spore germination protein n=1 Tax=Bacillus salipaludis TaxID=2547811 RepID=A0A4R5VJ69_9BACI|nr:Ger(x)C family spore germination protein [Bacillus salipaludis]MDQ6595519.1 Ger(x)C family spore germination protein [Bacillus salipaludis]TDK57197.1 Ger(x)C family spore germination protein [Bacillus salipaludis]